MNLHRFFIIKTWIIYVSKQNMWKNKANINETNNKTEKENLRTAVAS